MCVCVCVCVCVFIYSFFLSEMSKLYINTMKSFFYRISFLYNDLFWV